MTVAPVGLRCPDHSGRPQGVARVRRQVRRTRWAGTGALVTKALIAINVLVFLAEIGTGSGATGAGGGGSVVDRYALDGPDVANGGWWRLITAGFLHANVLHIGLNMLILWLVGSPLEEMLGRGRYLLLYFVSLLAGSAGAPPPAPPRPTGGAARAVFRPFRPPPLLADPPTGRVVRGPALRPVPVQPGFSFTFS